MVSEADSIIDNLIRKIEAALSMSATISPKQRETGNKESSGDSKID
jgi:hypothetical protein